MRPMATRDTLSLKPDGSAAGGFPGLFFTYGPIIRWKLGDSYMDFGMLCLGPVQTWYCTGFRVRGDTLSLADQDFSAYIRVRDDRSNKERQRIRREAEFIGASVGAKAPPFGAGRTPK